MARSIAILVLILAAMPLLAQRVTCTPGVPEKTCQGASEVFFEHTGFGGRTPIVISDPASYKQQKESLLQQMQRRGKLLGDFRNPVLFNGYTDSILFVRDDETCPTRVIMSTDLFRPSKPLKITKGAKGESVLAPMEYEEGFDRLSALHYSIYVSGFLDGCMSGHDAYIVDEAAKARQKK